MDSMFNGCISINQSFYNWNGSIELSGDEIIIYLPDNSTNNMFVDCSSLEFNYCNGNVTTQTISGAYHLYNTNYNEYILKHYDFEVLDTISVTSLDNLFRDSPDFNINISNWNTSNVVSLKSTFENCISFDQDLSGWDTAKVTTINSVFLGAKVFNSPVNTWDVTNVIDASGAFMNATKFSQNIWNWKMSSCKDFTNMFNGAISIVAENLTDSCYGTFETNNNFYMQLLID